MAPSDAREWVKRLRALMPGVAIEAFRGWKNDARRNMKSPVMSLTDAGDIEEVPGRYYLRFADARPKRSRRGSDSGYRRSRSQRSITWFVVTLEEQIRLMRVKKSEPSASADFAPVQAPVEEQT